MGLRRGVDAALLAAMSGSVWHPLMLVDIDWPGMRLRLHSGTGWLIFDGQTWAGVGRFGAVALPGEGSGIGAQPMTMTLLGLPQEALAMGAQRIRGRRGDVYVGAMAGPPRGDGATALLGTPYRLFSGYMDALRYTVQRQGEQTLHGLQLELGAGPSARSAAAVNHSAEDQTAKHPADSAGRWLIDAQRRVEAMTWPES